MSIQSIQRDRVWCHRTEQRTFAASIAAHAILLVLLAQLRHVAPPEDRITEVSLLESGPADTPAPPSAAAPAAPAPRTQAGSLHENRTEHAFRRVESGDTAPDAQAAKAIQDRLNARLATLQHDDGAVLAGLSSIVPSMPQLAKAAGIDGGTGAGPAMALHRAPQGDGGGGAAPLALVRGGGGGGSDIALAALPAERAAHGSGPPPQAVPRKSLAGMSLAGPIADRAVLVATRPVYPEWAKQEAVEGAVTLHFVVLPDGSVKSDVLVQKTAGFEDFDANAVTALQSWRFAALPPGRTGDQWGTITFQYRLVDGR